MATIEVKLRSDFSTALFESQIRDKVLIGGVAAMAKVIYDEVKVNVQKGGAKYPGVVTGHLRDSIYRVYSPERSNPTKQTYRISWNRSKAPHGHLIEFGTSRAPAYPFLRPAFDRVDDAIRAGTAAMKTALDAKP